VATTAVVVPGCAALGATVCLAGIVVHRYAVLRSGLVLPWGLVLGLVTPYAVIRAVNATPVAVRGAASFAAGWLLFLLLAHRSRPEGDFLVAGDWLGTVFVLGGMAVVALAAIRSIAEART